MLIHAHYAVSWASYRCQTVGFSDAYTPEMRLFQPFCTFPIRGATDCHCIKVSTMIER
jgi:hypothetical protein